MLQVRARASPKGWRLFPESLNPHLNVAELGLCRLVGFMLVPVLQEGVCVRNSVCVHIIVNNVLKDPLTRWWLEEKDHGVGEGEKPQLSGGQETMHCTWRFFAFFFFFNHESFRYWKNNMLGRKHTFTWIKKVFFTVHTFTTYSVAQLAVQERNEF